MEEEEQSDGAVDDIIAKYNNSPEGCKNNGGHYILGKCIKASNIANIMDTIKKGADAVGAGGIADLADKAKNNVNKADSALNKAEDAKEKYDKYKEEKAAAEAEKQAEQNSNSEVFAGLTDEEKAIFGQIEEEEPDEELNDMLKQFQKDECKKSGGYYVMGKCVTQSDAKEIANMAKEGAGVIKSDNLADGVKKALDVFKGHKS